MKNLLWVGDAACSSGFGRASHHILENMRHDWNVTVLGVNFNGDPHPDDPYPIYPAWPGGDPLGLGRLKEIVKKSCADVIVIQSNPWHMPHYARQLHLMGHGDIPVVGIVAVEGKNVNGEDLNRLQRAIFWTEFARAEAIKGGLTIPSDVVGLGVDTEFFTPGDRQEARDLIRLPAVPAGAFLVTNVNRNQNRKRIDLSILFFAKWIKANNIRDAYLYLHLLRGSSTTVNCEQLVRYCGMEDRLILAEPRDVFQGAPEAYVRAAYRASNIGLTTTLGEGWGLTTMEAMACGRTQIAGRYAAIEEWGKDAVYFVECNSEGVMPDVNNMIGSAPRESDVISGLDYFYRNQPVLELLNARSRAHVCQSQFSWPNLAARFAFSIEEVLRA